MTFKERAGRAAYYILRPGIHFFLHGTRRAYVAFEHDGKILVLKNVLGRGTWHLPGGGCKKGESFEEAALREVREEVGVQVVTSQFTQLSEQPFRSKRNFDYALYLIRLNHPVELRLDVLEILDAQWVEPSELNESNAGESVLQAVAALAG